MKKPMASSEVDTVYAEGRSAAEAALRDSPLPIFLKDELTDSQRNTVRAMGWNSLWASDENRRRLRALQSKSAEQEASM
jgi:hypothetical protein